MRNTEQCERLAFEEALLGQYMPDFHVHDRAGRPYIEGWVRTNAGNRYRGRIAIPENYPDVQPRLYVVSPGKLKRRGSWRSVNSLGTTHSFHTLSNGPHGCVQICHTRNWDASRTCVQVLLKLVAWLEAYEAHLRTGRDPADFLCTD